jgi:hypothetical protein
MPTVFGVTAVSEISPAWQPFDRRHRWRLAVVYLALAGSRVGSSPDSVEYVALDLDKFTLICRAGHRSSTQRSPGARHRAAHGRFACRRDYAIIARQQGKFRLPPCLAVSSSAREVYQKVIAGAGRPRAQRQPPVSGRRHRRSISVIGSGRRAPYEHDDEGESAVFTRAAGEIEASRCSGATLAKVSR